MCPIWWYSPERATAIRRSRPQLPRPPSISAGSRRLSLRLSDSGDEASRLAADRLRNALGIVGSKAVVTMLEATLADPDASDATRGSAVRALARSRQGAARILTLAKSGKLVGASVQAAGVAISASPWGDLRNEAAGVLPLPKVRDGGQLPSVAELMRQEGDASRGQTLFAGAATCAKCHVVNGRGQGRRSRSLRSGNQTLTAGPL